MKRKTDYARIAVASFLIGFQHNHVPILVWIGALLVIGAWDIATVWSSGKEMNE